MKSSSVFIIVLFFLAGCKDRFDLPVRDSDNAMLVVEGVLVTGGTTTITLSRSDKLGRSFQFRPLINAQVVVEGKDNTMQSLAQAGQGRYTANLTLEQGKEYRLHIKAGDGRLYESDYVLVRETPDIDSVNWKKENGGLMIYVNTHDNGNNSRYYKWEWEETWEYNTSFFAEYLYQAPNIVPIPPNMNIYYCWSTAKSSSIIIASSERLQSDVIFEAPVAYVPFGSEKLAKRYSILVKQYVLDKTGYEYLELMKKNTESLGSVFDPQPSELRGNIRCLSNPEEGVIGYLTASSQKEKRIFITSAQAGWSYHVPCSDMKIINHPDTVYKYMNTLSYLPWTAEGPPGAPSAYWIAPNYCVDCRLRGGTNVRPAFW